MMHLHQQLKLASKVVKKALAQLLSNIFARKSMAHLSLSRLESASKANSIRERKHITYGPPNIITKSL
jgi:hypothetical protein